MSKGLGKFVLFCAAAGVYYYLNKKDGELNGDSEDDDFDDFDDFDDDTDSASDEHGRGYVNIGHNSDSADDKGHSAASDEASDESSDEPEADEAPDETEEFFDDDEDTTDK